MNAIFKKELRSYFYSPIGYIFAGIFITLCSFFFIGGPLIYQVADINIVFSNINVVYLFLVSILTMGLFSVERSKRTDQLLLTSPVSITKIVAGKYLAALGVFGITLALSLIYIVILNMFGSPAFSETLGAYIGFILLWGAFIAIGLFISALTESQMIAAVITFGVLLIVFYINSLASGITNETVKSVVHWFSLMDRYAEFQTGILNIVNVVYYLSFIGIFLFLTVQAIRRRQYSDKKILANNMIVTVAVIAGVILVNAIVTSLSAKLPLKIDLTREKVYEYSDQTKNVLKELDKKVQIYALYPDESSGMYVDTVKENIEQYKNLSDNIEVIYEDPYENPAFVKQYGDNVSIGSVIVVQGERSRIIPFEKIFVQSQYMPVTFIDAEKQLTSAIRYVSGMGQDVKVSFISGHNELSAENSKLKAEFENEGYTVNEITIAKDGIAEDTDLIVSLAPSVDFTKEERDALDSYMQKGGKAGFIFSAGTPQLERLYSYLNEWGIGVNSDLVYENDPKHSFRSQQGAQAPAPIMQEHKISEKLMENEAAMFLPVSCSFNISDSNPQYAKVTPLLKTTKDSWGIKDFARETLEKQEGDTQGPLTVSAISEKSEENSGKIFVLGSLYSVEGEGMLTESAYINGDFVMNSFSYLTDKGDVLDIRAKTISKERLTMSQQQMGITVIIIQYVIPLLILLIGFIVWFRRRYL